MTAKTEIGKAIEELMHVWNTVYAEALKRGPHNPAGSKDRAEQLTRAYMSGHLQTKGTQHES